MRFEVLAEVAVQAILDGYNREAVSSFAASLERFFEFFAQTAYLTRHENLESFKRTWKIVQKQSERQLGLFLGIYIQETGETPPILSDENYAFRNKVIHQGYIPNEAESVAFGQAVINIVHATTKVILEKYPEALKNIALAHSRTAANLAGADDLVGYMSHSMVYRLDHERQPEPMSLADELAQRRTSISSKLRWAAMPDK